MGLQKNGCDKSCLIFCDLYNWAQNKSKILTNLIYIIIIIKLTLSNMPDINHQTVGHHNCIACQRSLHRPGITNKISSSSSFSKDLAFWSMLSMLSSLPSSENWKDSLFITFLRIQLIHLSSSVQLSQKRESDSTLTLTYEFLGGIYLSPGMIVWLFVDDHGALL